MSRLQVRAKFWPLLQQRLEADTLIIEGLTLNLAKNKKGKNNWDDLLQNKQTKTSTSSKTKDNNNSKTNLLAAFAINGVKINQSQFNFNDQQLKQNTSIKNIFLEIGQLQANTPIPINSHFEIQQKDISAEINIENKITFSNDFKQFSFQDITLESKTKLAGIKNNQQIEINSQLVTLNLTKQLAKSKSLTLAVNKVKLKTNFTAKNILSNPTVNAQIVVNTLNPRTTAKELDIVLPPMSDKKALTKFSAKFNAFANTKKIVLSNIKLVLDDTNITGNTNIKLPSASILNLNVDAINLDRYLPEESKKKNTKKNTSTKAVEAALIPIALLTKVDLLANVKINKLQIKKTHWEKLHLTAKAKQGNVNISPIKLHGYGSTITSNLIIKTTKKSASLSAALNVKNIKSGDILKDFMGVKNLQGLTSVNANINTKGIKLSQLKQNLNGKARFSLKDGIIKGFDLEYEINKLDAKIKQKPAPATPSPLQTKITKLSASALIKNGIIYNKDLRAATPFTRIIGRGNINLPKEQLDYTATVKLTNSRDIKNDKPFEKMSAVPLDIHIRGSFDKPKIKADFSKALKTLAKRALKKKEEIIKEKAKDKLKKKLGDELKNLFKF